MPNGPAVCIISHELWQTRFGGRAYASSARRSRSTASRGRSSASCRRGCRAPFAQVQVFAPRVFEVGGLTPVQIQAGAGYSQPIARLQPGVSLTQASQRARRARSQPTSSSSRPGSTPTTPAIPRPYVAALVGNLEPTFYTLLGAVELRAADRVRERGVAVPRPADRAAQGNRRPPVARRDARAASSGSSSIESLVFSTVAGALGVVLALWALSGDSVARRHAAAAEHGADAQLARAARSPAAVTLVSGAARRPGAGAAGVDARSSSTC